MAPAFLQAEKRGMASTQALSSALLAISVWVIGAMPASAAQTRTTFQVTSTVPASCTVTAAPLDFGAYHGVQDDQSGSVTVTCSKGIPYRIGLDNGLHYRAPYRRLKHRTSDNYLIYELYRDAGRTARWGNDDASSVHMTGDGAAQRINIYGRVPAGQKGPGGSYSNVTTVTVNF